VLLAGSSEVAAGPSVQGHPYMDLQQGANSDDGRRAAPGKEVEGTTATMGERRFFFLRRGDAGGACKEKGRLLMGGGGPAAERLG